MRQTLTAGNKLYVLKYLADSAQALSLHQYLKIKIKSFRFE